MVKRIVMAALLLAALAGSAWGQTQKEEGASLGTSTYQLNGSTVAQPPSPILPLMVGGRTDDSLSSTFRFDASGNLKTTESAPASSFIVQRQNWKTGVLVCGNSDSTDAVSVRGANRINLYLWGLPDSLAAAVVFGVRIQAHFYSGTTDTNVIARVWLRGNVAAAAVTDSLGGFIGNFARTGTVVDSTLMPGEIPWVVNGYRSLAGTLRNRDFPPMLMVPLVDRNGAALQCDKISVHLRLYKSYQDTNMSPNTTTSHYCYYKINLEGVR